MPDTPNDTHGDEVGHDVQWYMDADGTEWFAEDGVRFELADDGFAYPVVGGTTDPAGATPLIVEHLEPGEEPHGAPRSPFAPEADGAAAVGDATGDATQPRTIRVTSEPSAAGTDLLDEDVADEDVADEDVADEDVADEDVDATGDVPVVTITEPSRDPAPARTDDGRIDAEPLLKLEALRAGYGSLPVLKGVDMDIRPGETAVLLGLNGAGKTTTAWTVCGALAPWDGAIRFDGQDVGGWNTSKAVANGVVMIPEGRRVFPDLSVGRNLQVGAWGKRGDSDWVHAQRERVFDYFPRLRERESQLAGTLSGGEQQMLAMGRGLMADPRLLIVDEASMGLAPVIVKDVFDIISQINADGVTVLLIEQNVGALEVADVGYVMEQGHVVRTLVGEELRDRSVVSEALMG